MLYALASQGCFVSVSELHVAQLLYATEAVRRKRLRGRAAGEAGGEEADGDEGSRELRDVRALRVELLPALEQALSLEEPKALGLGAFEHLGLALTALNGVDGEEEDEALAHAQRLFLGKLQALLQAVGSGEGVGEEEELEEEEADDDEQRGEKRAKQPGAQ